MTEILRDFYATSLTRQSVVTIGSFDGVHRGHAYLIETVVKSARERDANSVAVTLNPHPKLILRPDVPLLLISTMEERLAALSRLGLDFVVVFPFSLEHSRLKAREFVMLLREHLNMIELHCGPNFALGYKREGTVGVLRELGEELGFKLIVVEPKQFDDGVISSTRIRDFVATGDVADAARLLGRYPSMTGVVVHGDHRGRTLGYPTANLDVPIGKLIPANGIYAVRVRLGDEWFNGAASIGVRPTFGGGKRLVEVYIFDFDREIYGQEMQVQFVARLRDELKFEHVDELLDQMARDVGAARVLLQETTTPTADERASAHV